MPSLFHINYHYAPYNDKLLILKINKIKNEKGE